MFSFIFIAKYIYSIAAMEIICSKTYFSLLYELFKVEVPKITQKWEWTKCFPFNSPLVIKSQIQLTCIKRQIYKSNNLEKFINLINIILRISKITSESLN